MRDPILEFINYNRAFARRNPELLRLKVARMAETPFAFFRGTFHLWAKDVLSHFFECLPLLSGEGPELDLVGDIHSENYGTYAAADGQVHYDVNDFDETTHGRLDFDVCRLATSLYLVGRDCGHTVAESVQLTLAGVTTYADTVQRVLKKGKGLEFDLTGSTAKKFLPIAELIVKSASIKRNQFIDKVTEKHDAQRRLRRTLRYFNLPEGERQQAVRLLEDYCKRMPEPVAKEFFEVQDVCGRVSGVGSMGRLRYVVLINGKGNDQARNILLEFKESRPSAYDIYRGREAGDAALAQRAERVITVQRESQVASNPYLGWAVDGTMSFQVRELGPHDARVELRELKALPPLESVVRVQAGVLARTHARAAGRAIGPSNPLAELRDIEAFCQRVLAVALAYADLVQRDWARFVGQRGDLENCEKWSQSS